MPVKKQVLIDVWDCGRHQHENLESACLCIKKSLSHRGRTKRWTPDKYREVLEKRHGGVKFKELASIYGISSGRAQQIYRKALVMGAYGKLGDDVVEDCKLRREEFRQH